MTSLFRFWKKMLMWIYDIKENFYSIVKKFECIQGQYINIGHKELFLFSVGVENVPFMKLYLELLTPQTNGFKNYISEQNTKKNPQKCNYNVLNKTIYVIITL